MPRDVEDASIPSLLLFPVLREASTLVWNIGIGRPSGRYATARLRDGRRLRCDLSDRTHRSMALGGFEPRESAMVRTILRPGDTFVDVGAHIGWYTTLAGGIVGPVGSVIALEPYPQSASLLRMNVTLNGLDNINLHQVALSDASGELALGVQSGSDSGSATAGPRAAENVSMVAARTLDSVVPDGCIRLVKIDVEGFESKVLAGGVEVMSRTEAVLIELNRSALAVNRSSPGEIREHLRAYGLKQQQVLPPLRRHRLLPVEMPANLLATR